MSRWFWLWLRLPGWPPVPRSLWLLLGCFGLCGISLLLNKELWPHTPQAKSLFALGLWLALAVIPAQLTWLAWRWLDAW